MIHIHTTSVSYCFQEVLCIWLLNTETIQGKKKCCIFFLKYLLIYFLHILNHWCIQLHEKPFREEVLFTLYRQERRWLVQDLKSNLLQKRELNTAQKVPDLITSFTATLSSWIYVFLVT